MKHTTLTTIYTTLLVAVLALAAGPTGCSCTGSSSGLEAELLDGAPAERSVAPSAPPAHDLVQPAAIAPVLEAEEEHPLPIEEEDEEVEASDEADDRVDEAAEAEEPSEEERLERHPLEAVAYQFVTNVVAEPAPRSRVIGYLRRGARVRVTEEVEGRGCDRGWHHVEGGGYVCHASGVVVGEHPDDWPDAPAPPQLDAPLPYTYYSAVVEDLPEYRELPSRDQEAQAAAAVGALRAPADAEEEPEVEGGDGEADSASSSEETVAIAETDGEEEEEEGSSLPSFLRILLQRGFIVSTNQVSGRWIRTARGRYVERTKMVEREAPEFQGVELDPERTLPLGFVVRGRAKALRPRPGASLRFEVAGTLRRLSAVPILGEVLRRDRRYLSIGGRLLARASVLAVAEPIVRPPEVGPDERWIDVDLSSQTLVAYEGDEPVFATLVSTGRSADGFDTPTGVFRIRTKHVSATMDDPDGGEEAYSIEDVPWTMYFHESYALHGAFWHNHFGRERSHGCINLSPADARWLFSWAGPELPPGWHGVRSSHERPGTAVVIRH